MDPINIASPVVLNCGNNSRVRRWLRLEMGWVGVSRAPGHTNGSNARSMRSKMACILISKVKAFSGLSMVPGETWPFRLGKYRYNAHHMVVFASL